jgi:hypothetical protein
MVMSDLSAYTDDGFYAGTVSAQDFIALRNAMEDALTAWEADREAA